MRKIRIGTRGSKLARRQACLVQEALLQADSGIGTEIVIVRTKGDSVQDKPLAEIGEKGVFASELEQALKAGEIDLAVHSAKDLPMKLAEGLCVCAVLPRADVRDVLVISEGGRMPVPAGRVWKPGDKERMSGADMESVKALKMAEALEFADVSDGRFVIGTGSRRRQQQAERMWENVVCENIRGNVDTRLRKLRDGGGDGIFYDGILLAKAGLDRLGIGSGQEEGLAFVSLPPEAFLPAACQGIIAVEALQDSPAAVLCGDITDAETELCFLVEREVLAGLSADCSEAIAAWCRREGDGLTLDVMYAGHRKRLTCAAKTGDGLELARRAAELVKPFG